MLKQNSTIKRLTSILGVSLLLTGATQPKESPVADAAQTGDIAEVRALLQQGAAVNAAQTDGLTALHWAAMNNHGEIIDVLLYAGATVKPLTRVGGYTPLHLAARSGHAEIVTKLTAAGADPDEWTTTGVTAIHFAAQANSAETIRALAEAGANLDAPDEFQNRTPLVFASARNSTDALTALLELGADPSVQTALKDIRRWMLTTAMTGHTGPVLGPRRPERKSSKTTTQTGSPNSRGNSSRRPLTPHSPQKKT